MDVQRVNDEQTHAYVEAALAFRDRYPDCLESLQRGQLRSWLVELEETRLDGFLSGFSALLADADRVALGARHHMNARAVWRSLSQGGEIRQGFDRQLVDAVQLQRESAAPLDRFRTLATALADAGYALPAGLVFGDESSGNVYHEFAARAPAFLREYDMELRFAYSNRYSGLFGLPSPRYDRFINEWMELMTLAHAGEIPGSAPGAIRNAWQKFGPQNELHGKWTEWLRRAVDDVKGAIAISGHESTAASLSEKYRAEARLSFHRLKAFLEALRTSAIADISLEDLGIEDLESALNVNNEDNDHG